MTDNLPSITELASEPLPDFAPVDAYELLSKPTLELTDTEVDIVIHDLRQRRARWVNSGQKAPDKPKAAKAKAAKEKPTDALRAAATQSLLADLNLDL
jgi:hypothetical protein